MKSASTKGVSGVDIEVWTQSNTLTHIAGNGRSKGLYCYNIIGVLGQHVSSELPAGGPKDPRHWY